MPFLLLLFTAGIFTGVFFRRVFLICGIWNIPIKSRLLHLFLAVISGIIVAGIRIFRLGIFLGSFFRINGNFFTLSGRLVMICLILGLFFGILRTGVSVFLGFSRVFLGIWP
uniref:Uncharacterized protein n=1 Tax=Opuntia streptacantha TaxID=393608 RepID=A0A7C9A6M2_OPUST